MSSKISALTTDATPDNTADYVATYNASDATKSYKVLLQNLGAFVLPMITWYNVSPADSTTYYISAFPGQGLTTVAANQKIRIPRTGKILAVYLDGICTTGTTENSTVSFRLNDTTDTTISSVVKFSASPFSFSNTALSIAVTAGDYYNIKIVTPAWATNPTGIFMNAIVYMA